MATFQLSDLARLLDLTLQGGDGTISGVNTLELASPTELSFLSNLRYADKLAETKALAVIVPPEFKHRVKIALISSNPYQDFGRILSLFAKPQGSFSGISPLAFVHPEAEIDPSVTIYPFVFVGARAKIGARTQLFSHCYVGEDSQIGEDCILYPSATLMAATSIGHKCILHAGCVLGADGFGFVRVESPLGQHVQKVPQIGRVVLGNNVEVGANTTIDRAVLNATTIGNNTKLDNLVQVGHNVCVGDNCFLVAHVGISGSTVIGNSTTLAGQVGIAGHLHIGNNVTIGPQSGVAKNIPDNQIMGGTPAVEQGTFMRTLTLMPRFPEIFKRLSQLEKAVQNLLHKE